MKKLLPILMLAMVAGCGNRQAVEPGDGSEINVPNDSGGYAGDMADPPAEQATVDPKVLEENVEAGSLTDSRDRAEEPENPDQHAEEVATKEEPAGDPAFAKERVKTGDARWASNAKPVAAFQFNKGVVYLELWPDVAPKHVESFESLIGKQFYDGIYVHRVEKGFVMQAGDPVTKEMGPYGPGVGTGGPGYTVPAEFSDKPHLKGTLAMARSNDPNSAGSQFYICLDRAASLDGQYTVFGQVLGDGMDIVDKLEVGDQIMFAWMVKK